MRGNARMLRRALDSLLDNAVDHTPATGAICLTARWARGRAALTIQDTGPGIALYPVYGTWRTRQTSGGFAKERVVVEGVDETGSATTTGQDTSKRR